MQALSQSTSTVLMIRPASFSFNEETAVTNEYQKRVDLSHDNVLKKVLEEFDEAVEILRDNDIDVTVIDDTKEPVKPDAIFPNNWVSMHHDGTIVLYAMKTKNRRSERRSDIIEQLGNRFEIYKIHDNAIEWEDRDLAMEGTGSIVFDHQNRIAYASISPRTEKEAVLYYCNLLQYKPCIFTSYTSSGNQQYHTNVVMSVSSDFVLIGLESIKDKAEAQQVKRTILESNKKLISLTSKQLEKNFCGNVLQLKNKYGQSKLVMSETALSGFTEDQLELIQNYTDIVSVPISLIEKIGGGSARCMIAEIFLPLKSVL